MRRNSAIPAIRITLFFMFGLIFVAFLMYKPIPEKIDRIMASTNCDSDNVFYICESVKKEYHCSLAFRGVCGIENISIAVFCKNKERCKEELKGYKVFFDE